MIKNFFHYNINVQLVLITTLLSNVGIFMVIPFLAIYLNELNTVTTAQVGLVIGIAFWCQRAGSFLGGILSDYVHVKATMLLGLLVRIPGYLLVGFVNNFYLLVISCSLIGLGSSIYLPAAKSFLVKIIGKTDRIDILATRVIFSNIGVAIGPVLGAMVFKLSPTILFTSAGGIFLLLSILNIKLKGGEGDAEQGKAKFTDFKNLTQSKLMIFIALFMFLFMLLYMQIEVTIPMFVSTLFNSEAASYIFVCNAGVVIFFQSSVAKWACNGDNKYPIVLTFALFAITFLTLNYMTDSYYALLFAVVIFSFAEIIIQIRLDYEASNVEQCMIATAFGIMSLAGAFGGLLGSYIGTLLYSNSNFRFSIWEIFSAFSAAISLICLITAFTTNNRSHNE